MRRLSTTELGWIIPVYFVLAAVDFAGTPYLFRFSSSARAALDSNDGEALTAAFRSLKVHYAITGMSIIGGVVLYMALIIGIIGFGLTQPRTPFSDAYA